LSKHFVEVPLKMAYFDKVFRQRMPTKDADKDSAIWSPGQALGRSGTTQSQVYARYLPSVAVATREECGFIKVDEVFSCNGARIERRSPLPGGFLRQHLYLGTLDPAIGK
jgi:hypothetical protein